MSRGAGRVFVKAPESYLSESPANTQATWDSLTANGQKEIQRPYVIADKAVAGGSSTDKRGRKSSPPQHWLDEDESHTKEVWINMDRQSQKMIRIKYTTGKYRRLLDEARKEKKRNEIFTKEKRGRPVRICGALLDIFLVIIQLNDDEECISPHEQALSYIGKEYEHYVFMLFYPIVDAVIELLKSHPDMTFKTLTTKLLKFSKLMNVRIKALNDVWDRLKGAKSKGRWRRFKMPIGYTGSASEWPKLSAIEQLLKIHEHEYTRYIALNDTQDDAFIMEFVGADDGIGEAPVFSNEVDIDALEGIDMEEEESSNSPDEDVISKLLAGPNENKWV